MLQAGWGIQNAEAWKWNLAILIRAQVEDARLISPSKMCSI